MSSLSESIQRHNESLTLQDLHDGGNSLMFRCTKCGTTRSLNLAQEIARNGAQTRVSFIKRNAKCPYCG